MKICGFVVGGGIGMAASSVAIRIIAATVMGPVGVTVIGGVTLAAGFIGKNIG